MEPRTPTPSQTFDPVDIVTFIVETACGMLEILAHKRGLTEPLMHRVFRRLRRLGARFAKLAAQIAAGELPDPAPPRRTAALRLPRRARPRPVEETFAPEPEPPQPADHDGWPQWRAPEPLSDSEEEISKIDPPERPPKNRD